MTSGSAVTTVHMPRPGRSVLAVSHASGTAIAAAPAPTVTASVVLRRSSESVSGRQIASQAAAGSSTTTTNR